MKLYLIIITGLVLSISSFASESISDRVDALIPALIQVESNGKEKAIGDAGKAFGILQLHRSYVDDVNRIYKTRFKHSDAFDSEKAKKITKLYLLYYGRRYESKTGNKISFEVLARIHNGGPSGYMKSATSAYWKKVMKSM